MNIGSIMRKLGDMLFSRKEYVYQPKDGGPPIYISGEGVLNLKLKREDVCKWLTRDKIEALNRASLRDWGLETHHQAHHRAAPAAQSHKACPHCGRGTGAAGETQTAGAGETRQAAPKNSLRRPEGAD